MAVFCVKDWSATVASPKDNPVGAAATAMAKLSVAETWPSRLAV